MSLAGFRDFFGGKRESRPDGPTHAILARHGEGKTEVMVVELDHSKGTYKYHDGISPGTEPLSKTVKHNQKFDVNLRNAVEKLGKQIPKIGGRKLVHDLTGHESPLGFHELIQQHYPGYRNASVLIGHKKIYNT